MQLDKRKKLYVEVAVVVLVVAALALNSQTNPVLLQSINQPVIQSQMAAMHAIANNQSLANKVGLGVIGLQSFPTKVLGSPLVLNGKPTVLYIGAEYCPFCAATRWGLVLALMRFGNLSNIKYMTSSSTDYAASTPTFTFVNSGYSSQYINFLPVETANNTGAPLQTLQQWQNTTFFKYDVPTSACPSGGCIPFIDFGNRTVQLGADYSPMIIHPYTWAEIINMLNDTSTPVSQAVIGSADVFTAQICAINNYTPSSVCSAPYVMQAVNES